MHPKSINNGKYDPLISSRQFTFDNPKVYLSVDQANKVSEIIKQIVFSGIEIYDFDEEDDICMIDDLDE